MSYMVRFNSRQRHERLFSLTRLFLYPFPFTAGRSCPAVKLSVFEFYEKYPDRNLYHRLLSDG